MTSLDRIARRVSIALAVVAAVASALSFFAWRMFERDVPMVVGNMRGTALTVLAVAIPLLLWSSRAAARGSLRARFVWMAALAYLAYNAVMFCFAVSFNSLFLLYATLLSLSFWSLVTLVRTFDLSDVDRATAEVPSRLVAAYLVLCLVAFASLWLSEILPATAANAMPATVEQLGLGQNPVWVLDFAFTFPLMALGSLWMLQGRAWGYVVSGTMVVMLTIETLGVAVDQVFGRMHDPSASLGAVPVMIAFTVAGAAVSALFLRGVRGVEASARPSPPQA